ncbi:peroxisomal targeting signal 1 receptor [Genlisea aurea]|uniref:Peroxisomal targeting signal 1 receptor n=1 Tax=Genlisea aurea TaxID=192259 RepID=S8CI12_9LAMI|nr:peroxisomal targeting signal 1 receptor [Genlisea aurea]
MAMRELVTGGAACAVPETSSSNPLGALANSLIGSSSKTQERLREIPSATVTSHGSLDLGVEEPFASLPGSELEYIQPPNAQGSEFLKGFRSVDQSGFSDAWNEIRRPQIPQYHVREGLFNIASAQPQLQQDFDGPPQRVLSNFLHSFLHTSHGGIPFQPAAMPTLGLSNEDKRCIRDRSSIMARHIFADKSEEFIHSQVNALLSSLDIDGRARGPIPGKFPELEEYWNESQGVRPRTHVAEVWVSEFAQVPRDDPNMWVQSFERQHSSNGWASEFEHEQNQISMVDHMQASKYSKLAAMEQTRMLAHTLSQNNDPKFQNSKFLQFVSKMSRGEITIQDNELKPALPEPGDWAAEYEKHYSGGHSWADQFANEHSRAGSASHGPQDWASEYSGFNGHLENEWVNEFSKLNVSNDNAEDWANAFELQMANGILGDSSTESWANAYDEYLDQQLSAKQSGGVYVFSDLNPYVGHPNPLKEGIELFRKGLLSEAVLAFEAEVLKNPDNSEGWRLLGVTHAENDDDQQAIAAMMKAHEADPTNLEVLLALGVSYTNELEQASALKYMHSWLRHHPKYGSIFLPDQAQNLYLADVSRSFQDAAKMAPDDADVHIVLGVLYNLSREYDKAIEAFETALKLKPRDYSLWNKLGATKANSIRSADAIYAYQHALDLKPNYVRAWANMGISYANQGMYEDSIRYYVRALAMNPKADNAWQYLRISLSCATRDDMIEACDVRNLDALQKEFPL